MKRRGPVAICLALLLLSTGCIGLLTGDDGQDEPTPTIETTTEADAPRFSLGFELNRSVADGIGFDYTVTNIGSDSGTARLVVYANTSDGTSYQKTRTLTIPAGESRNVTVAFEAFDEYSEPSSVSADVYVVDEES
jgi:hypothetical protein